jgi:putative heme-binding domain-containing protein
VGRSGLNRWALCAALLSVAAAAGAQRVNPFEADAAAQKAGASLFAARCADCHGPDAKGNRGPDLTTLWSRGAADDRVFGSIRNGVPGSIMPPSTAPDAELWAIVAHLRSISTVAPLVSDGDAVEGKKLFAEHCAACHRAGVDGAGGIGPDLSSVARQRSRGALVQSIREPSAVVAEGFRAIALRTRRGENLVGVLKREDAFSIQIVTEDARLVGFSIDELAAVTRGRASPMPAFGVDRLGDRALEDLLAFLAVSAEHAAASRPAAGSSQ